MQTHEILLDGTWRLGDTGTAVTVPGLAGPPDRPADGPVRLLRDVQLPPGDWTHATLVLNGARFCPAVSVDGQVVSRAAGGMAPTRHRLAHAAVRPGATVRLGVELVSLRDVPEADASRIPPADLWRSNVSSCLWDRVVLRLHGSAALVSLTHEYNNLSNRLKVGWRVDAAPGGAELQVALRDGGGNVLGEAQAAVTTPAGTLELQLNTRPRTWSPEDPHLYELAAELRVAGVVSDRQVQSAGLRAFGVDGQQFVLNGRPCTLRAGSVVWHRWVRDPEAESLAWDTEWFRRHVVVPLKQRGANTLRFHLGTPPEALLDLCDREGLLVQYEWLFFHGIAASRESMVEQWRAWLALGLKHPCVVLVHPWNETDDAPALQQATEAIESLEPEFPRFVLSHRDVIHAHRYWWSLFENLGLDYDSADDFDRPVMADEFGGNYLDGAGDPGPYPSNKDSLARFLGRDHTREDRLQLQADANGRVAEYWRRIGVAGYSPFCILGSREDGNHHYLGALREGRLKPVWDALSAAYAPVSCSLELWDRNFAPGEVRTVPLHLFNDTRLPHEVRAVVDVAAAAGAATGRSEQFRFSIRPHERQVVDAELHLPDEEGEWLARAAVPAAADGLRPALSAWAVRTLCVRVPEGLAGKKVFIPGEEDELLSLCDERGVRVATDAGAADILCLGHAAWGVDGDLRSEARAWLADALGAGRRVLMLDAGPRDDGHGRAAEAGANPTIEQPHLREPRLRQVRLAGGVELRFQESVQGESCIHPADGGGALWWNVPRGATRLWNGMRGGLIVPAWDMEASGLRAEAFLAIWRERGAEPAAIAAGPYLALELGGQYEFTADDPAGAEQRLRERVRFLMEDAPALAPLLNPKGVVRRIDLAQQYRDSMAGQARALIPLVCAGRALRRLPVVRVEFDNGACLLVSQLFTAGRLHRDFAQPGLYGIRYDPAAEQMALNMLAALSA